MPKAKTGVEGGLPFGDLKWVEEPAKPKATEFDPRAEIARLQGQIEGMSRQPKAPVARAKADEFTPRPEKVDLSGLDPMDDSFTAKASERFNQALDNRRFNEAHYNREAQSIKTKTDGLWKDFSAQYKHLADKEELVAYLAEQAVQEAIGAGYDSNDYMFGAGRDEFFKVVRERADKLIGHKASEDDSQDEGEGSSLEDDLRTEILAGVESGGKPARGPKDQGAKPRSMFDSLSDWQQRTGFHI